MGRLVSKLQGRSLREWVSSAMWRKGLRAAVGAWRGEREARRLQRAGDGVAPPPDMMVLEVTMRCNLRCPMCYLTDEARAVKPGDELSLPQIEALLDRVGARRVNLVGGEPFMRRDLFDILDALRRRGLRAPSLTTNGVLLNRDRAERLAPFLMDGTVGQLTFSIDGPPPIHNEIRGAGMLERTLEGMRRVADAAPGRRFAINITVSEINFRRLDEAVEIPGLSDMVNNVVVNHMMFAAPREIEATMKALQDSDPAHFCADVPQAPAIDPNALSAALERLLAKAARLGLPVTFRPNAPLHALASLYSDGKPLRARCLHPYYVLRVQSNGQVAFCPLIRAPMGDAASQPIADIWNGETFRRFRKALIQRRVFPICRRCCRLEIL